MEEAWDLRGKNKKRREWGENGGKEWKNGREGIS